MILPDFGYGGAERSFSNLSVILSERYEIVVVVFNTASTQTYPLGGKLLSLEVEKAHNPVQKIINLFRRISRLKAIKRTEKPDVSISFLEGANILNQLSRINDKVILSVRGSIYHDQNLNDLKGIFYRKVIFPKIYDKADSITTLSNGLRDEILSKNPSIQSETVHTIYNSINIKKIQELSSEELSDSWKSIFRKYMVLVMSSRLAEEKGIQHFLPIFKKIFDRVQTARLLIIGDGPLENVLKRITSNIGLNYSSENIVKSPELEQVWFIGRQNNPFKWINKSNMFVSTSTHEGFGNSILEALACDTFVISSDCPYGPREVLSAKPISGPYPIFADYGTLMPIPDGSVNKEKIWVEVITNLLASSVPEHGNTNRLERVGQFSQNLISKNWFQLIEKLRNSD